MTEQQVSNKTHNLTIRFDIAQLEELRRLANSKGMGVTTLIRMWVLERLHKDKIEH